jgi:hypothetical protein
MNDDYEKRSADAIMHFNLFVKEPLQKMLGGTIFSVENDAKNESDISKILDRSASSDLIVKFDKAGTIFTAASRILYANDEEQCEKNPISPTFRNSKNGSYENTELDKLNRAVTEFNEKKPVVLPRYLCYARVYPKPNPTNIHEILAIETIPVIEHIFDNSGINIHALRQQQSEKGTDIHFDESLRGRAGIRQTKQGTAKTVTFLYISKSYLEEKNLPFLYESLGHHRENNRSSSSDQEVKQPKTLSRTAEKNNLEKDKKPQLNHRPTPYEIEINSRYSQKDEIEEMEQFRRIAVKRNLDFYVKELFYDSKCNSCRIDLTDGLVDDKIISRIFEVAINTLSYFELDNTFYSRSVYIKEYNQSVYEDPEQENDEVDYCTECDGSGEGDYGQLCPQCGGTGENFHVAGIE